MNRCEACLYWVRAPTIYSETGICHRYPPRDTGAIVVTPHSFWCGEGKQPNGEEDRQKREWTEA